MSDNDDDKPRRGESVGKYAKRTGKKMNKSTQSQSYCGGNNGTCRLPGGHGGRCV